MSESGLIVLGCLLGFTCCFFITFIPSFCYYKKYHPGQSINSIQSTVDFFVIVGGICINVCCSLVGCAIGGVIAYKLID